jgi:hypothetical protein
MPIVLVMVSQITVWYLGYLRGLVDRWNKGLA